MPISAVTRKLLQSVTDEEDALESNKNICKKIKISDKQSPPPRTTILLLRASLPLYDHHPFPHKEF
jgi:hypothetical protein